MDKISQNARSPGQKKGKISQDKVQLDGQSVTGLNVGQNVTG